MTILLYKIMKSSITLIRLLLAALIICILSPNTSWAQATYTCGSNFNDGSTGSSTSYTFTPNTNGYIIRIDGLDNGFSVVPGDYLTLDGISYNNSSVPPAQIHSTQINGTILGSFTDVNPAPSTWQSTVSCVCDNNPTATTITAFPNPICPDVTLTGSDFTISGGKVDGYGTPSPLYLIEFQYRYAPSTVWISGLPAPPLTPGTLEIQIRLKRNDTAGCTSPWSSLVQIGVLSQPTATVSGQSNVGCYAGTDGSITITASGGTGPYQFSLDNGTNYTSGSNPYTFYNLTAGTYYPRVKDANSCESPSCP